MPSWSTHAYLWRPAACLLRCAAVRRLRLCRRRLRQNCPTCRGCSATCVHAATTWRTPPPSCFRRLPRSRHRLRPRLAVSAPPCRGAGQRALRSFRHGPTRVEAPRPSQPPDPIGGSNARCSTELHKRRREPHPDLALWPGAAWNEQGWRPDQSPGRVRPRMPHLAGVARLKARAPGHTDQMGRPRGLGIPITGEASGGRRPAGVSSLG